MTTIRIGMGLRLAVPALLALSLMGCASGSYDARDDDAAPVQLASALPRESGTNHVESQAGQQALQCVPYAREHSQIKITGDAWTWWDQAAGKYERGANPAAGTVMVLTNYAGPQRGHVAVVRRVVSAREIRIDHANWLDDGSIYVNDPVVDVSAANDWSQVKVWNIKTGGWGVKIFPVQGFIGSGSASMPDGREAPRSNLSEPTDDDAAPADLLTASVEEAQAPPAQRSVPASPVQRVAAAPRARTKSAPAALAPRITSLVPVAATDLDPAPDSGHALTADDLSIP